MTTKSNWMEKAEFVGTRPQGRSTPNLLRDNLKKTLSGGEKKAFRVEASAIPRLKGLRTQVAQIAKALGARSHVIQDGTYIYMWIEKGKGLQVTKSSAPAKPRVLKSA